MAVNRMGMLLWRSERIDAEGIARFAREAEGAGFDELWIPETWVREAGIQLALAAQATERIRLGSGIFNIYGRSPGLLAQTAAEIDVLSGGRFDLGLGVSGPAVIENWHAQPFDRPLRRSREVVAALRMALAGERVNLAGETVRMEGFRLRRKPVQERLPIYLAANGPDNTRLTGEIADGWIPHFVPFSRTEESIAPLAEGAARAGRALAEVDVAPFVFTAPDDNVGRARERVKPSIAFYIGAMGDYYHAQLTRYGYGEAADAIRAGWKRGGRAAAAREVPDDLVDDLALCGPLPRIAEGLDRLRGAGVTHPILRILEDVEEGETAGLLEGLGKLR
ncbi:MAG: LLM class flavin-dependent oxidoreductase [bacterium]